MSADEDEVLKQQLIRLLEIYLSSVESQRKADTPIELSMYLDGQRDACNFIMDHINKK